MRIAWVTPVESGTGISAYSRQVVAALRHHAEVEVWAPHREAASGYAPDHAFSDLDAAADRLTAYDHVVYNLGNNPFYHREIYRLSRRRPGTVILHDRSLSGFFTGLGADEFGDLATFLSMTDTLYGPRAKRSAAEALTARIGLSWADSEDVLRLSFVERALAGHQAAVTHSLVHAAEVSRAWPGPVLSQPFPTYPDAVRARPTPPRSTGRLTLVSAGILNANKRVDAVIDVLARDRALAERVTYLVVGSAPVHDEYARLVLRRIHENDLRGTVKLLGRQSPATFARILQQADVHLNLRFPALEGGSASAMEQLATGRPLVVYDIGSLSELPDEVALKLAPGDGDALGSALWRLVTQPALRAEMGAAARREAEARSVDRYARALLDFLASVELWRWRPLIERLDGELRAVGLGSDLGTRCRLGRHVAQLIPEFDRGRPDAAVSGG